jgi:hypothetical protein
MAKKRKPKISGALAMQSELEELFFEAKKSGNIKHAGYLAQVWASLEGHAALEREKDKGEKTALDDLVEILKDMRSQYVNNSEGVIEDE